MNGRAHDCRYIFHKGSPDVMFERHGKAMLWRLAGYRRRQMVLIHMHPIPGSLQSYKYIVMVIQDPVTSFEAFGNNSRSSTTRWKVLCILVL
jgi:hypothetical protein